MNTTVTATYAVRTIHNGSTDVEYALNEYRFSYVWMKHTVAHSTSPRRVLGTS